LAWPDHALAHDHHPPSLLRPEFQADRSVFDLLFHLVEPLAQMDLSQPIFTFAIGAGLMMQAVGIRQRQLIFRNLSAAAATIPPHLFQFHAEAKDGSVFADGTYSATRVIDGACIFHNRSGFEGGEGCALHLAAEHFDESPVDWKPSVCWQLPIKIDWEMRDDNVEVATVRRWSRADWGEHGTKMAWCCTEGTDAYIGGSSVLDSLGDELSEIVGTEVFVQLRNRLK
jgi:hypothetical protein